MDLEICTHVNHGTLDLMPHSTYANIVIGKWVFTLLYNLDGPISFHKAHLVARCFNQVYGIGYT